MLESNRLFLKNNQNTLIQFSVALVVLIILTLDTLIDMVTVWIKSDTYNHCFLILPISLYLIYEERTRWLPLVWQKSQLGAWIFSLAAFAWVVFSLADIKLLAQLALITLLIALVFSFAGFKALKPIWFPLFFLYFMVPAGSELVPVLRDITAQFSVAALKLSDIPVFLDSRYISIPTGDFFVAEACSGINYLIATITLGVLYAYYQYQSWYRRLAFVALSLFVPILANGIRAYGIIMVAYWSDNEYATGIDHIIYGWIWFGVVLLLLFSLGNLFKEKQKSKATTNEDSKSLPPSRPAFVFFTLIAGMMILFLPWLIASAQHKHSNERLISSLITEGWTKNSNTLLDGQYPNAHHAVSLTNPSNFPAIELNIVQYTGDQQTEIISSINSPFNKAQWQELETLELNSERWVRIKDSHNDAFLVQELYIVDDHWVASSWDLMVSDLSNKLRFESTNSYVVVIGLPEGNYQQNSGHVKKLKMQLNRIITD